MRKVLLLVWLVLASGWSSLGGMEEPPVEPNLLCTSAIFLAVACVSRLMMLS